MSLVQENVLIRSKVQSETSELGVIETQWGYRVNCQSFETYSPKLGRLVGSFIATILVVVTIGIWSYGGLITDPALLVMKLGLTALFIGASGLLFGFADDAGQTETQIDLDRREIRLGRSDKEGRFVSLNCVPFCEIGSIELLKRSKQEEVAGLYARIGEEFAAVELATGPARLLGPIRERIEADLMAPPRSGGLDIRTPRKPEALLLPQAAMVG